MKSKKQSAITLIESLIVGLVMWFIPQEHWVFKAFASWKLVMGVFGVVMLVVIAFLSIKEED